MEALGLAAPLVLALVLALSGLAKLRSPRAASDSFISLRMPGWLSRSAAPRLMPWAELLLVLALLVLPGWLGLAAAAVTLLLMLVYLAVILRALGFEEPVDCGCFGELGLGEVTARTAWRNSLLVILALSAVAAAALDDRAVVQRWWQADAVHWGWLAVTILVVALTVLVIGGPLTGNAQATGQSADADDEVLDYLRQHTPFVQMSTADGQKVMLRDLARQQAQLLLFVNNYCGSCLRVTGQMDTWQEALGPAVAIRAVYAVTGPEALDSLDPRVQMAAPTALYDPERQLVQMLEAHGSPSAVLVGTDDMLAGGPVRGEDEVVAFVEEVIAELRAAHGE